MEKANRVHPHHSSSDYVGLKHHIFTFHDSTLEFVAREFSFEVTEGTPESAALDCWNSVT